MKQEIPEFTCGYCGSTEFKIFMGETEDNRTLLFIVCANSECDSINAEEPTFLEIIEISKQDEEEKKPKILN